MPMPLTSDKDFARIVEQAVVGVLQADRDGRMVFVNHRWCEMLGYSAEELRVLTIFDVTYPDDVGRTREEVFRLAQGEGSCVLDKRYLRKDGTALQATSSANAVRDAAGNFEGLVAFVVDQSRQTQMEASLRASEDRLNKALSIGRMNAWDWDPASGTVSCSANAIEFWGRQVGRGEDFLAVIHPEDAPRLRQAAADAFSGQAAFDVEYRLCRADRSLRWVQSLGEVQYGSDGRPARLLGMTIDVTEKKQAEAALRLLADAGQTLGASLDYQATLRDLAAVFIPRLADWYAVDLLTPAGELERVSVAHPDPAKVEIGKALHAEYPPQPDDSRGTWGVIKTGEPDWMEYIPAELMEQGARDERHLFLLRTLRLQSYICAPLRARGVTIGVITLVYAESGRRYQGEDVRLVMDIARRAAAAVDNARLYQELQLADRRKDEFLAMLAHELRNPLAPISTAAHLLQMAAGQNGPVLQASRIIARQVAHMTELVDDLLDVSRVTRGLVELEQAPVDLKNVVTAAVEQVQPLIEKHGHALSTWSSAEPLVVMGDRARLIRVVANLLNNAAKYTPPGGTIELRVERWGQKVRISVRDNGIGMDKALLPHVFDLFTQAERTPDRAQGGLGIGLALVRSIARLHGGDIHAQSKGRNTGSLFVVELPPAEGHASASTMAPSFSEQPAGTLRILIVDDNVDAAQALAEVLRLQGHRVATAASAAQALMLVDQDPVPDVFILDIGLPDMSGYELVRALRGKGVKQALFVALTGYGQEHDRKQAMAAGFDEHMVKPADIRLLLGVLHRAGLAGR